MTTKEFLSYMNSGQEVIAFSEIHLKMTELSNEAMKITAELNNAYGFSRKPIMPEFPVNNRQNFF